MNKKLIISLILTICLVIPIVSAGMNWDNLKGELIKNETTSQYGRIYIYNWNVIGKIFDIKVASIEPKRNTDTCGSSCSSRIEIIMYQDGILIDDVKFMEKQSDEIWKETSIPYKFYIITKGNEWIVNDYRNDCKLSGAYYPNGTEIKACELISSGTHYENNFIYEEYKLGTEVKTGIYEIELRGERSSNKWIDWQITAQGKLLDEFLVWGEYISSFSTSGEGAMLGGATNGSVIITVSSNTAYFYNMSGSYIKSVSLEGTNTNVYGIDWNGTNWITHDFTVKKVYRYGVNMNFISTCTTGLLNIVDIAVNSSNMWFVAYTGALYETDINCNVLHTYAGVPGYGITMNESNLFLVQQAARLVVKYYFDGSTDSLNFNLNANNNYAYGIDLFEDYFYVTDNGNPIPAVYKYYNAPSSEPPPSTSIVTTTLNSPINYFNSTSNTITFNCSATTTSPNGEILTNISLWLNTTGTWILNETKDVSGIYNNSIFNKNIPDGAWQWTCKAFDNSSQYGWGANRTFYIDTITPAIEIISPTQLMNYGFIGKNETLQWNITHPSGSLGIIWFSYNGTNITVYGISNSTLFTLANPPYNLTFYANDTVGNLNKTYLQWSYKILELNQSFLNATNEGSSVNFYAYVVVNETIEISSAVLNYNNTQYSGSISNLASYSVISKTNLITPEIAANTTFTFHWTLTLDDSSILNLSAKNQTVYNLILDNCTAYGNKLFDITLKDEELQSMLDNATLEIAINLYTSDKSTLLISLGAKYYDQNPISICSNLNLTASNYYIQTVMKYYASDYEQEYYNIDTSDFTLQNITLYDLNSTDSTPFKLTFTGTDFLPEEGVLVYVERQYIDENAFKTVELPKTDTNGQTIIHLVRNDVIYNLIFIKDGVILRRFENLRAFCDDYSIGDCKINLNALSEAADIFTYDKVIGITYDSAPTYNSTTNIVSFSYVSNDGTTKNVTMNVERRDVFGNNSVCSNTLNSVSGTLSCNIGSGITDTSLVIILQVDGQTWISTSVQIDTTAYGQIGYVAWFLLALGLVFMFSKDKNGILIALLLSYVGAVSMGWILGGIVGLGSAGIWIIIITLVGLWKLNKNKLS